MAHPLRKIRIRRLNQQMVMVRHQAVGMADPRKSRHRIPEEFQEDLSVLIVKEDILPRVAARGHMIGRPFVKVKRQDRTPDFLDPFWYTFKRGGAMIRQRRHRLRKAEFEQDLLSFSLLADVLGCDAEGDPLKAVRRNIPRPRFRIP